MSVDERLRAFDAAVTAFRDTSYEMHGPVGGLSGSDHTLRAHAGQTAYHVFACCDTLRLAYTAVHDDMRQGLLRFEAEFAGWPRGDEVPEEAYEAFWIEFRQRKATEAVQRVFGSARPFACK